MAYNFDGTDDFVRFDISPFNGYTFGPFTIAVFLKQNSVAATHAFISLGTSAPANRLGLRRGNTGDLTVVGATAATYAAGLTSTTNWLLIAVTKASGTSTPRFHYHNGTSWAHNNAGATLADVTAIGSGDWLRTGVSGSSSQFAPIDLVCAGIKKADSADATVETLSRTAFSAWTGFGFDWLIGFDSSLESAGILQDQGTPGTGDEVAITGTTTASDPPGWSWATAPASTFVPQIAIL